jgi:t-SNARE complex subunit (syntaxin)
MILKNRVINSTDKEERELSKKINIIINEAQKSQNQVDNIIKEIKLGLENKGITDNEKIDYRIKENLFGSMINKYKNTCTRFQKEENDIKKIIETKLVRAAEIAVNQELTEEQKRQVIEDPQMIQMMYENKLSGAAHIQLKNAVRDIEERHQDIKNLEKSILQLHKMIVELNALVQYQGEIIDNVEINIKKAKNYVFKAEKNINCAYKCAKCCESIRLKCACCGACCACCAACSCCTCCTII